MEVGDVRCYCGDRKRKEMVDDGKCHCGDRKGKEEIGGLGRKRGWEERGEGERGLSVGEREF